MKRHLLFFACLLNAVWASAQFSGSGTGTESDPYLIYNESQLYQMNNFLGDSHAGVVFKLMKDLDLTEFISENFPLEGWQPIGIASNPFEGKLYGNGHTISGIWINRVTTDNVGFFGCTKNAIIQKLMLNEKSIKAKNFVGSIIGMAINTTVSGCKATTITSISGGGSIGGLVGKSESSNFTSCTYEGLINETATSSGGIVGYATNGSVNQCNVNATIVGTKNIGGIIGQILETVSITNSKYTGDLHGSAAVGGIAGKLASGSNVTFTSCHSKGKITNSGDYTGGIIGQNLGGRIASMESCIHFGDISGKQYVGGIIGAKINNNDENVYVSKSGTTNTKYMTKSTESFVTGEITKKINNCVCVGNINGSNYIGGIIGWDEQTYSCLDYSNGGADSFTVTSSGGTYYLWYGEKYTGTCATIGSSSSTSINIGKKTWSPNFKTNTLSISNSYYSGNITGDSDVGGICGYKSCGSIISCYTNATINGKTNVGGIIGRINGLEKSMLLVKSNVTINNTISASISHIGRIYGKTENSNFEIGALASANGNKALSTTQVFKQGVKQTITDNLQNGNAIGSSLLKMKATYVGMNWNFDDNWNILETECYPYKKYQAAPPTLENKPISQATEICGSSINGGTVYMQYLGKSTSMVCSGNNWRFTTDPLQSGATIQLYVDVDGKAPSYLTSTTVSYPGSGTEDDPFLIYTAEDLQGTSNAGYYKLMNDIDLTSWISKNSPTEGWVSIGRNGSDVTYINGEGHKITGLWTNTTNDYTGLFSNFSSGVIKNLNVEVASGKKVKGGNYTGILIGRIENGQIVNCSVKGDAEGTFNIGGVVGYIQKTTLDNISFDGKVTSKSDNSFVGGIVGQGGGTEATFINNCKSNSTINSSGSNAMVGGLAGKLLNGTTQKSFAETNVSSTGSNCSVGGLVGWNNFKTIYCYSAGTVSAKGENSVTGGLIGYTEWITEDCYSKANVSGTQYTAGLIGYSLHSISRCYATGNINGVMYGAGIVGELEYSNASLTNSVAANNILTLTAESSWGCRVIGGFKNGAAEPALGSNYALNTMQVSLNGVAQKKTDDNIEGVAKTIDALTEKATYQALGWDFENVWGIDEGADYPYLLFEKPEPEYILGDVTGDGNVSVADAAGAVSIILNEEVPNLNRAAADVTGEGEISVADVAGIVNIILGGDASSVKARETDIGHSDPSIALNCYDGTFAMSLSSNADEFTAIQFDMVLPDGIDIKTDAEGYVELNTTSRTCKHLATAAQMEDGIWRVICYSLDNRSIRDVDGEILIFPLEGRVTRHDADIQIQSVELVRTDLSVVHPAGIMFRYTDATGIESISESEKAIVIYNLSGQKLSTPSKGVNIINGNKVYNKQ